MVKNLIFKTVSTYLKSNVEVNVTTEYPLMTFCDSHVYKNLFKIAHLLFRTNDYQKSAKITILIPLKYQYTTILQRHGSVFQ